MTRPTRTLIALAALSFSGVALAQTDPAACCAMSTSRVDALLNPVSGGDEKFFSSSGGIPNVFLAYASSDSLFSWPRPVCTVAAGAEGCACTDMDVGYVDAVTNLPEWNNINSGNRLNDWFRPDYVYQILDNYGPATSVAPLGIIASGGVRSTNVTSACATTTNPASCNSCLVSKGYYIDSNPLLSRTVGNYLNLNAPKYVVMRRTIKEVVRQIRPIRMSIGSYYSNTSTDVPACLRDYNPPCSQILSGGGNWQSNRQNIVNKINQEITYGPGAGLLSKLQLLGGWSYNWYLDPIYNQAPPAGFGSAAAWTLPLLITPTQYSQQTIGFQEKNSPNEKAVCASCIFSSIIVFTDGQASFGGLEDAIPAPVGDAANELTVAGCPECLDNDFDEMAKYLWDRDMRPDTEWTGKQSVATYVVGFGVNPTSWQDKLFRSAARQGGGLYFNAQSAGALAGALQNTFEHISSRSVAFSSAAVATLQVQGGAGGQAAVIPRMSPRRDRAWIGELYRFTFWNEFVQGAEAGGANPAGSAANDGDLDDIYLADTLGRMVDEDSNGQFIRKGTVIPATPWFEARNKLRARGHAGRFIYTAIDRNADGRYTSADMPLAELSTTSPDYAVIKGSLGVIGTTYCPNVATGDDGLLLQKMGLTLAQAQYLVQTPPALIPATPAPVTLQSDADDICAKALIQFVRGQDMADEDGLDDGTGAARGGTRFAVLGDIFHSSPVGVDPPIDRFICDLGLHNQCVRTLYSNALGQTAHTPLAAPSITPTDVCGAPADLQDAYGEYAYNNRLRDRVVLVGANDGMVHAFVDDHNRTESCVSGAPVVSTPVGNYSGEEAWAFIPPDILPRLQEGVFKHTYLMDGDIMVRDIWEDANADGTKQANEFHTMAVVAEGRGGLHYFALEVQFDLAGRPAAPGFRWLFPQPCEPLSQQMGKTLYALSPKPPPIGPVLLDSASVGFGGTPVNRYGVDTVERWVTMLSGGWSPGRERGRGVYMVDVWNGAVNGRPDNLLWKWDYDPSPPSGDHQFARQFLTHSIVAPVAMVDYGSNTQVGLDGFFDTALFGDTGGQLWLTRMFRPGTLDPTTGLVNNWGGGRAFQQDLPGSPGIINKWPFFYLASTGVQPENNALRAFLGTGNRYSLIDDDVGACRFDNPAACSRRGCTDVEVRTLFQTPAISADFQNRWQTGALTSSAQNLGASPVVPANFCAAGAISAQVDVDRMVSCPTDGGVVTYDNVRPYGVACTVDLAGNLSCDRTFSADAGASLEGDLPLMPAGSGQGNNRFYGIWAYGGNNPTRQFDETITTGGDSGWTYDQARLTDRPDAGILANVTGTTCTQAGCTGPQASASSFGWMYEYPAYQYKTASGSALLASCVLWTNLYPTTSSGFSACATTAAVSSQFFQADFITGAPNCAYSFLNDAGVYSRFQDRSVIAPPPEPGTAVAISPTGQIRYSTLLVEPGNDQVTQVTISNSQDLLQSVYELPVTQAEHICRHRDAGMCIVEVP